MIHAYCWSNYGAVQLLVGMWEVRRNNVFGVVAFGRAVHVDSP
jgi:succinate-acetate transporter protein